MRSVCHLSRRAARGTPVARGPAGRRRRPGPIARSVLATALALGLGTALARPSVVVSIHPYYDLTSTVAGVHADVVRILPPGASPHTYDATPRDVGRIVGADLVIMNGGLDLWLLDLVEAAGGAAPILEVIALPAVQEVVRGAFPDLVTVDAAGATVGFNAHVWLDPLVMVAAVDGIAEALADLDPPNADAYRANAAALALELEALHEELAASLADVRGAPFVPFHDAWPYFAARYGLDLVVEIEPFPGREPSPAYLRRALGAIRDSGASAVFNEVQLNRRAAEVVAAEAGVALFELDPLGGGEGRERYAELMRENAAIIVAALR